jgi:propionyl-CoA synthetase
MDPSPSLQSQSPDAVHSRSLEDPAGFWSQQAERLFWDQKPKAVLHTARKTLKSGASHPTWDWFPGGKISTCYNCVDRHVKAGRGDQVALYYDSPVTSSKEKFTYSRLLGEVETLAGALREKGVCKGDVVMLYSK